MRHDPGDISQAECLIHFAQFGADIVTLFGQRKSLFSGKSLTVAPKLPVRVRVQSCEKDLADTGLVGFSSRTSFTDSG